MSLVDHLLQFSDKQAIAAGASTNTLDTVHKSVGTAGLPVCLQGHVVGPANATVTVTLEEKCGRYNVYSSSRHQKRLQQLN
nr:hypothetical protein [Acinetobacter baumannii]